MYFYFDFIHVCVFMRCVFTELIDYIYLQGIYVYVFKEIYYKELAHLIVKLSGKPEHWKPSRNRGCRLRAEFLLWETSGLPHRRQVLRWGSPILRGVIRFAQSQLIFPCWPHLHNTFRTTPRFVFDLITGHYSLTNGHLKWTATSPLYLQNKTQTLP